MSTDELLRSTAVAAAETPTLAVPTLNGGLAPHPGSRLFGRGLLYVIIWSLQIAAGVVVSPVLAYALGPTEFGWLASAIALHQVLIVLALLGLDQALILQGAEDGHDRSARGLVAVGIVVAFGVTLLFGVTAPLWSSALGFGGSSSLVVATILWTGPCAAVEVMLALLLVEDRLRPFALVGVLSAVGGQVVGIALLLLAHADASTYAWGGVVSQFAAMSIAIAITRPRLRGLIDWGIARRAFKLGIPLAMGGLAFFVLNAGDRIVIQRFLGGAEVGRYQIAYTVGYVVVLLLTFTSAAWAPHFAALRDERERWALSAQSRDEIYRLLIPIVLGVTLVGPIVLRVTAPASFGPDSLVVVVFLVALSAFPVAASGASGRLLVTLRRGKALAMIAGSAALFNIGLNILLVPVMGITGSAAATLAAFGLLALLQLRALPAVPRWRRPPARLVVAIGSAILAAGMSVLLPQTPAWNIARMVAAVACLPWLLLRLSSARRGPKDAGSTSGKHRRPTTTGGRAFTGKLRPGTAPSEGVA